jgi:hypothetical protein
MEMSIGFSVQVMKFMKNLLFIWIVYVFSLCVTSCNRSNDQQVLDKQDNNEQQKTYYASDLNIKILHPSSIFMSRIGSVHSAYNSENKCLTTIEFTTAPQSWQPPYFKILESSVDGKKEEYNLPGIVGINTVNKKDDLSIFYGELSSAPLASKVLQVRTSNLNCQELHLTIVRGMSAM